MNLTFKRHQPQARKLSLLASSLGIGLAMSLLMWTFVASASPTGQGQALNPLTIPAGGTANLTVRGFCMDFGKPFPVDNTAPKGLADDKIRAALN